ncbi:MAG: MmgE/PrpD family protein [Burkholderiales bacterium]|nr:MmgE/PrpD family protein [Burkholderiales bacterium]
MDQTTRKLARYVAALDYRQLSGNTVRAAKKHLIDSIACLIGGYDSEPAAIARRLASRSRGEPRARVLGSGAPTTMEMATFANTVMLRYLDYNDHYVSVGSGHPSDMIPACLAAADALDADGKRILTAIVAAYEVFAALADQVPLGQLGWDQGVFVVLGAAAGAGLLLGLNTEQLGDAMAIGITSSVATRQTRSGELAMWKGCATAAAARSGVFAALLAKEGMSGPTAAFEGFNGVWDKVTGKFHLGEFGSPDRPFGIERANLKYFPSEYHSQAPLWMALDLRTRVALEDIAAIEVQTYHYAYSEIGSEPQKWDPQSRETADHSLPYLLALAFMDGAIRVDSFSAQRMRDPATRALMQKIRVSENPEFTRRYPAAMMTRIEVQSRHGERHEAAASYPRGHARNPMTDAEVEAKFESLAQGLMPAARCAALLDALRHIEQAPAIGPVLDLIRLDHAV